MSIYWYQFFLSQCYGILMQIEVLFCCGLTKINRHDLFKIGITIKVMHYSVMQLQLPMRNIIELKSSVTFKFQNNSVCTLTRKVHTSSVIYFLNWKFLKNILSPQVLDFGHVSHVYKNIWSSKYSFLYPFIFIKCVVLTSIQLSFHLPRIFVLC